MAKEKKVLLAGIPNAFWDLRPIDDPGEVIEEFDTKADAIKFARKNKLRIVKTEVHKD